MSSDLRGSEILQLLEGLTPEPLSEDIRDLYHAAYKSMLTDPEKSIELGQKALVTLDRLSSIPLGDANALAYAKGRCHLLLASIYLDQEVDLKSAEKHYLYSRDEFHSRQWSHLESLVYLGLAITRWKLKIFKEALIACKSAQDSVEHESIPDRIDTTYLRKAIKKERLEIQKLLSQELLPRIPIVSDIAAGLGRIAEDNVKDYLILDDYERKVADFGMIVMGDSMKDQGIFSGDVALIRRQPVVEMGEIAALVITTPTESVGVLKQYYTYQKRSDLQHWFLKSSNPTSEHLVVIPSKANISGIRDLYKKATETGKIHNPIKFYENAELIIAGKYVGSVRERERESRA